MRTVPELEEITIYAGDTYTFPVTLKDANGDLIDVSAGTFTCEIREEETDTDAIASFSTNVVGTGEVELTLAKAESEKLRDYKKVKWDLQYEESSSVTTYFKGDIRITKDVSR